MVDNHCRPGVNKVKQVKTDLVSSFKSSIPRVVEITTDPVVLSFVVPCEAPVCVVIEPVKECDVALQLDLSSNKKSSSYTLPSFKRSVTVQRFIKYLVGAKTFSLGHVKRRMHSYLSTERGRKQQFNQIVKADGRLVQDMFDPVLFRPGEERLPEGSHPLHTDKMIYYHKNICSACRSQPTGVLAKDCYFATMVACVDCGWDPPIDESKIYRRYKAPPGHNYKTVSQFHVSTRKEFDDMRGHGVVERCEPDPRGRINPLGSVVKGADKVRARVIAGVEVVDQDTLTEASDFLVDKGLPRIKARVITDVTATGINGAAYSPPFSYPSLADGLMLVYRNCYCAKADIGRFFHSFPFALRCRYLFMIYFMGLLWWYARCFFGFTACPYYCSTFSAEIKAWLEFLGVATAHMMDDFLLVGLTLEEAQTKMKVLIEVLESVGFYMAVDKLEFGQQLVFLGVLIDTVRMCLRFDSTQAEGMKLQMEVYLEQLRSGRDLDHSTIRHVCGKLNWFSEVVQSGRCHTKAWWLYEKFHSELHHGTRLQLLSDTVWWIAVLDKWAEGKSSECEYRIWSASELLENPHELVIMQSDASGVDGIGYFSGFYSDSELDYKYVAKKWPSHYVLEDMDSHLEELLALEDYLLETQLQDVLLVWISDSESAVWSINKGRCHDVAAMVVVSNVLCLCDVAHIQIVALWVPREENVVADYLSHFAHISDRDERRGFLRDLGIFEHSGEEGGRHESPRQD